MQVTYKKPTKENKLSSFRKENNFCNQISVIVPCANELYQNHFAKEIITARFYITESRCYCCIWVSATEKEIWSHGGAYAGGYGYHRGSSALQSALSAAGFELNENIAGRGETAMHDALLAIANFLGYGKAQILAAHA